MRIDKTGDNAAPTQVGPPVGGGTDVTEFYDLGEDLPLKLYWSLFGKARGRTNARNMQATLDRIKLAAETSSDGPAEGPAEEGH